MSEDRDPVEFALQRLAAVFNPPEVADPEQFRMEFRTALKDFPPEALIDGVSEVIKTRRAKSFPSIGEVRTACMDTLPKRADQRAQVYHDQEKRDEQRRAYFIGRLKGHSQLDWMLSKGLHVRALEFAMEHDRLPDSDDWRAMRADIDKVQAHLDEALGPSPHYFITRMAEAVQYRRDKLAEELNPQPKETAA